MNFIHDFVSDSFNGMGDIRKVLQNEHVDKWAYGCATHCLNNLSVDLTKITYMTDTIKQCVYVRKTDNNTALVSKVFHTQCKSIWAKRLL